MIIKLINSITDIGSIQWNELLNSNYPFLRYEFLAALENSGAVSETSGWLPRHCLVYETQGDSDVLIAIMPLYEKHNSNGEYIFDHIWADAYHRNGLAYFPKWVTAVPFTPCEGARLLINKTADPIIVYQAITSFLKSQAVENNISSWHCLFPTKPEIDILREADLIIRETVQFRWANQNYKHFDDYLSHFSMKKRKNVRRERRWVQEQGIELVKISGSDITEQQWQAFYPFYQMTYLKRNMSPYLSLSFFHELAATMPEQLLLIMAVKNGVYIGAALSFVGDDTLYGRYWGCFDEYNSLHFEACYYQGLEYCIEHKLQRFDSGAQGEHKISRGFQPVTTYSAHWINDSQFSTAIDRYVKQETQSMAEYKKSAAQLLPFKTEE